VIKRPAVLPLLLAIRVLFLSTAKAAIQIAFVEITDASGNISTEFGYWDPVVITMN
jgi:hypothetical protein